MTHLSDLDLTPRQREALEDADPDLVQLWLDALATKTGLTNPVGWFYSGVRSGKPPGHVSDITKAKAVELAERYIRNAGHYNPTETSLLDDLLGEHGKLHAWENDRNLRERMLTLYRREQPRGQQADLERDQRAERWRTQNGVELQPDDGTSIVLPFELDALTARE